MGDQLEETAAAAVALPISPVPRAYQIEMFEESMKGNAIVVMDTGSGKTQIAILRIAAELDRCPSHKIVWLTVPTVALAQQQHAVVSRQLPAYHSRLLSGADNLDRWTNQALWDAVLRNVRIVLSTSQVLVDALTHGFVKLETVALLVFDEAHHVQSNNSLNRMMQILYHPKSSTTPDKLPCILGLTASPIMGKDPNAVRRLENNLNAKCVSPRRHLSELMEYVWRPALESVQTTSGKTIPSECLKLLVDKVKAMSLDDDPYIRYLMKVDTPESQEKLSIFRGPETKELPYCTRQLRALCRRANDLLQDLGVWAAESLIILCARRSISYPACLPLRLSVEDEEKHFISDILRPFAARRVPALEHDGCGGLSDKASKLLGFLSRQSDPDTTGIVFVKMRSTAAILAKLISLHPLTSHKYKASPFVGSTFASKKADILELTDPTVQKSALAAFRRGECNLIVATPALEEGIDVTATNLVILFDPPQNLRSYIQSRGRARKESSRFLVFLSPRDPVARDWNELELKMKEEYTKERATLEEENEKDMNELGERSFRVTKTGATLTLSNAKSHIQHFCDHLPKPLYSSNQPEYIYDGTRGDNVRATIILPMSVDLAVRKSHSTQRWQSEKMASNDAAFEAYVSLHRAGLVNDNLLASPAATVSFAPAYYQTSMHTVSTRTNPWADFTHSFESSLRPYKIIVEGNGLRAPPMLLLIPLKITGKIRVPLYRTPEEVVNVEIQAFQGFYGPYDLASATAATRLLLQSLFANRLQDLRLWNTAAFPYLFIPVAHRHDLATWIAESLGSTSVRDAKIVSEDQQSTRVQIQGLLRIKDEGGLVPYKVHRALYKIPERNPDRHLLPAGTNKAEELHFELSKVPRNRDLVSRNDSEVRHETKYRSVKDLQIDRLSVEYSDFVLFIPGILHYVEIAAIAQRLSDTVLAPIGLRNIAQLMDAISAPSSKGKGDYERLEFWGDCRLKYFVSLHLFTSKNLWHEGYLSQEKDKYLSNGRLCKAALDNHLDQFIHTDQFASHQWRPLLLANLKPGEQRGRKERLISSKTLADVVEALLGACDRDDITNNGMQREVKDMAFLKIFLPEIAWKSTHENIASIRSNIPSMDTGLFASFAKVEEKLLGYTFQNRLLLVEALTHPSCPPNSIASVRTSYERLEFLGDSVLDQIVISRLMSFSSTRYSTGFPPSLLTILRSIIVNADFLAYFCLGFSFEESRGDVVEDASTGQLLTKIDATDTLLWQFMRHYGSWEILSAQEATHKRYLDLRPAVKGALASCRTFPWALLAKVAPEKFFSDIIESIVAAIFIDSNGDLSAVEGFLYRLGVLGYLDKLLDAIDRDGEYKPRLNEKGVMIMQPKMQLSELAQAEQKAIDWSNIRQGQNRCFEGFVSVDGITLGSVENAQSRPAAETIAADEALERILSSTRGGMATHS